MAAIHLTNIITYSLQMQFLYRCRLSVK